MIDLDYLNEVLKTEFPESTVNFEKTDTGVTITIDGQVKEIRLDNELLIYILDKFGHDLELEVVEFIK